MNSCKTHSITIFEFGGEDLEDWGMDISKIWLYFKIDFKVDVWVDDVDALIYILGGVVGFVSLPERR